MPRQLQTVWEDLNFFNLRFKKVSTVETKMDIRSAISALKSDQRAVILLVLVEGYSYSEAGNILNIPTGTVASRVARARDILIDILAGPKAISSLVKDDEKRRVR